MTQGQDANQSPLTEPTFLAILHMMGINIMIALGRIPNPATGETQVEENRARWRKALLDILVEKTVGNLTDEEAAALTNVTGDIDRVWSETFASTSEEG